MAQNLKFLPDLWDRLRGGGTGEDLPQDAVFIFPVPGGTVTSGFGYRPDPVTGEVVFHTGIDIAAPEGTPILAALGGEVLFVDEDESYGKMVEIDHGLGMVTLYAHASEITVEVGDIVDQGDEIAKVGMTGKATSPHCHFEVIVSGQPVDPMQMKGLSEGP
jgi:murein DD-endopeptidase MepM/ murein hydrolase activator NlpD